MNYGMAHDGQILDDLLTELGAKKGQLAKKLGVNQNTITNYIKRDTISNDILIRIGQALRFDLSTKFPRLKKIPEATQLNYFNHNPDQLLKKVEELQGSYEKLSSAVADKDQKIGFLEERLETMQQIIDAKNEIIENLKARLKHYEA